MISHFRRIIKFISSSAKGHMLKFTEEFPKKQKMSGLSRESIGPNILKYSHCFWISLRTWSNSITQTSSKYTIFMGIQNSIILWPSCVLGNNCLMYCLKKKFFHSYRPVLYSLKSYLLFNTCIAIKLCIGIFFVIQEISNLKI